MKIIVKAKPRARKESIERVDKQASLGLDFASIESTSKQSMWAEVSVEVPAEIQGKNQILPVYKVSIKEPPVDGKANEAIVRVLAEYFKVSKSSVRLVSGSTSKQKVFEIGI